MSNVFTLLLTREARLLFRRPAELANPLVFFAIVIALFPLAVGPETELLKTLSPGLLWVAAHWSSGSFRRTPWRFWCWLRYWHTGCFLGWRWFCCRHCWR